MKVVFRARIVVVRPDALTEAQMEEAIVGVADTHPLYRAFMQLLEEAEEEAREQADRNFYVPRALEVHTGGAQYLKSLRLSVLERRARKKGK